MSRANPVLYFVKESVKHFDCSCFVYIHRISCCYRVYNNPKKVQIYVFFTYIIRYYYLYHSKKKDMFRQEQVTQNETGTKPRVSLGDETSANKSEFPPECRCRPCNISRSTVHKCSQVNTDQRWGGWMGSSCLSSVDFLFC